ncbi:MAG: type 1 glutamine amidotransferase [Pedococcus sp.]
METTSSPRILVVEHESNAGVGLVGRCIAERAWPMDVVGPAHADVPSSAPGYAGVVVLGGTPGPEDDDLADWLPCVRELVRDCLDRGVPLLGVCLGAQILAVVAGGAVTEALAGPEVGLIEVGWAAEADNDPLLHGLPDAAPALAWHWLEVVDLPVGSHSLASTSRCANQAFRVGPVAWGLQFHLEALAGTAREWASEEDLEPLGLSVEEVATSVADAEPRLVDVWSTVSRRWLGVVADVAARIGPAEPARARPSPPEPARARVTPCPEPPDVAG